MELDRMGGIYRLRPWLAILFFVPAFSLAGFPPLSGFWAKLLLIQSSLQVQQYAVAAVAVAVGLMTVYSMVKIWLEAFWKPLPPAALRSAMPPLSGWKIVPVCALVLVTVLIGIGAEPVYQLAAEAAGGVLDPRAYVQAVLKGGYP
jgi:multicomponent Na+:H+ antiporter subunit D